MFSVRLKSLRENAGFKSQQSFADAFGVAQSTVGNWEAGKREPNYATTICLADFFKVTVDYLIGHSTDYEKKPAAQSDEPTAHERDLILAYRAASPDDRAILDNIVSRYTPPEASRLA